MSRNLAWRSVVNAYQACNQRYARLMAHFDLTPSQFDVLLTIEALDNEAYPKQVAKSLLVTKSNITSITKRLLERKLIRQLESESDGRSFKFVLSAKGRTLLQRAKFAAKQFVGEQLAPFSDEEVEIVGSLMQRMRLHLESDEFGGALEEMKAMNGEMK